MKVQVEPRALRSVRLATQNDPVVLRRAVNLFTEGISHAVPFRNIVGHRRLLTLLSRAVSRDTLPPSLLLAGPAGIGKRRAAMAIAESVNCLNPQQTGEFVRDACGECPACRRIQRGVHPDVIVIGGGVGSIGDPLLDPARSAMMEALPGRAVRRPTPVVPARFGPEAGLVGAALAAGGVS